ncbi:MAG: type II toxin-antitoxin system HipA family toxin [Fibrobacteres bacterium]|nr:type II toxin-antitoxin system HipA family toxin [Fibrobacterota bacterium]
MERMIYVHVDWQGQPVLAGRLWMRMRKEKPSASFEYDAAWLKRPEKFSLDPALAAAPGPYHTVADQAVFGTIGDSAPDTWGRKLMRRAERIDAKKEGRPARTLVEADFLLQVDDRSRQGALRFSEIPSGPFLAVPDASPVPPLIALPKLLKATERLEKEEDGTADLRLLLAPGSSLGGARPKASILDRNGRLSIAKFPKPDDDYDTVRWEATALALAARAKIPVPSWRLELVNKKPVLILGRFDRNAAGRIPFLSAMSMLGAKDGEQRSYPEIGDCLRRFGANPTEDLRALWRRMVFNILISNTDDHLRNHGFLYEGQRGWRLSPAYDLNPIPSDIKQRILSTAIFEDDAQASMDTAFSVADRFAMTRQEAAGIAREVGKAVSNWREEAKKTGLGAGAQERMESAFEHEDAALVLKGE